MGGNVTISNTGQITATSLATSGDVIITGSLTVGNLLNTMSFYPVKPHVSLRVITSGGTPSTGTTTTPLPSTIGTPGTVSVTNYGFTTSVTTTRGSAGTTNAF